MNWYTGKLPTIRSDDFFLSFSKQSLIIPLYSLEQMYCKFSMFCIFHGQWHPQFGKIYIDLFNLVGVGFPYFILQVNKRCAAQWKSREEQGLAARALKTEFQGLTNSNCDFSQFPHFSHYIPNFWLLCPTVALPHTQTTIFFLLTKMVVFPSLFLD